MAVNCHSEKELHNEMSTELFFHSAVHKQRNMSWDKHIANFATFSQELVSRQRSLYSFHRRNYPGEKGGRQIPVFFAAIKVVSGDSCTTLCKNQNITTCVDLKLRCQIQLDSHHHRLSTAVDHREGCCGHRRYTPPNVASRPHCCLNAV